MSRCWIAGAVLAWALVALSASVEADADLDRMMRQMDSNPTPSTTPNARPRLPLAAPGGARNTWNAITSKVSDINAQLRSEFSLLDHVETDISALWDKAVAAEQDVVENWPFPHGYWAPGIVEDATETVMGPRGAGRVTAPLDDPDPDASPSPSPIEND
jgi:hypothetical protein